MNSTIFGDRYEIIQQRGKRAGRETLLARDLSTQELVVIKLLKFSSEFEWDDLKLFEREAQTLQELSHPQIPQYLNFFEFEVPEYKGFALVQTYIEAKSLEQHRQDGRTFTEDEVKQIAEQLLEILSYLHDRHPPVIHRDLKPSNILLGDRSAHHIGTVYLVDFGSVQTVAAVEGGTFTVVGTYGYMPPEQFGGRTVPASDLYSLGATLIYLLTGQHPADLPQNNLQIDIAKVVKLSPSFERWLGKLLEPSLDRRFISSEVALKELWISDTMNPLSEKTKTLYRSKVSIHKNQNNLTIIFPKHTLDCSSAPTTTNIEHIAAFLIFILWLSRNNIDIMKFFSDLMYFDFFMLIIYLLIMIFVVIFGLMISYATIVYIVSSLVDQLVLTVTVEIDRENLTIIKAKKYKISFPISSIVKIEKKLAYIARSIEEGDTSKKSASDTLVQTSIEIWAGATKCTIKNLSEPEIDFLGTELSDWLGLPLQHCSMPVIEYSIPKQQGP